ncbi:carboxylesterase family protein [soil metagenome]
MVAIPRLTVRTEYGSVLAVPHRGSLLFRNVPFAAPPFGALRFLPPRPPEIWDGLRDGAEPGVGMPQPLFGDPLERYTAPKAQGADALTLEVQTPELGRVGMPVMVWMHGGGFIGGAGSAPANDGYAFARSGIVHVSINSRLGIDGYALLEDSVEHHADNLGLRDQIAALQWVQRNIAGFGGDASNVTIAGQSTGASSVVYLLASPAARGLFVRAISQSGSTANWMTTSEAGRVAQLISTITGREPTAAALRNLDFEATSEVVAQALARVYGAAESWGMVGRIPLPFCGVIGTEMLPNSPIRALAEGSADDIRVLAGTTRDEVSAFFAQRFPGLTLDSPRGQQMLVAMGADDATVGNFRRALGKDATDLAVASSIATEVWARRPTLELLRAHRGVNYLYEFAWQSPFLGESLGSVQGLDLPFSRNDFENMQEVARGRSLLGKQPSRQLAETMNTAFVDFVKTGEPGWAPWGTDDRECMRFDDECSLEHGYQLMEESAGSRR